jgi:outer membrane receptor protein involved in Fe transport
MAFGFQWRDLEQNGLANPFDAAGWDYNTVIGAPLPKDEQYFSETRALFAEFQVPILATVDAQLAVRHERFEDFGLETTTPKIALRWEALPSFAIRGSWGESFLAPTPTQARPFVPAENCGEIYDGQDPFTGQQLTGGAQCSSGNPNLDPETSEIRNVGMTWEPGGQLDGLSLSLDYQEIEYTDRIRSLTEEDTVAFQFQQFLAETGISEGNYDPAPGSATRQQANAWLQDFAQQASAPVVRGPEQRVEFVYRQETNIIGGIIVIVFSGGDEMPDRNMRRKTFLLCLQQFRAYLGTNREDVNGAVCCAGGIGWIVTRKGFPRFPWI